MKCLYVQCLLPQRLSPPFDARKNARQRHKDSVQYDKHSLLGSYIAAFMTYDVFLFPSRYIRSPITLSDNSVGQEISTMNRTQMSERDASNEGIILQRRASSDLIAIPQRDPPPSKVGINEDSEYSTPSSGPESASSDATSFFFVLEEIQSTSNGHRTIRPATIRAVFIDKAAAKIAMEILVYESRDPPAARRVSCQGIFRDEHFLGEGYEYHTRSLRLRTLWIQESLQTEDAEVEVWDEESLKGEVEVQGEGDEEETPTARPQGGRSEAEWRRMVLAVDIQ